MPYYCPNCGQELKVGDGRFAPPLFCERCGEAWDRPEDGRFYIPLPEPDRRRQGQAKERKERNE